MQLVTLALRKATEKMKQELGLSLLEVLIAIFLLSAQSLALFSVFNLSRVLERTDRPEQEVCRISNFLNFEELNTELSLCPEKSLLLVQS